MVNISPLLDFVSHISGLYNTSTLRSLLQLAKAKNATRQKPVVNVNLNMILSTSKLRTDWMNGRNSPRDFRIVPRCSGDVTASISLYPILICNRDVTAHLSFVLVVVIEHLKFESHRSAFGWPESPRDFDLFGFRWVERVDLA